MKTPHRDTQGRFQLGTAGGPGRPPRATEANYLLAVIDACPLEVWQDIVKKAVADARDGCDKSRHWLASYLLGSPKGTAPSPSTALVGRMLGTDDVLNRAAKALAKPLASDEMFPILSADTARLRQLEAEAKDAILAAEEASADAESTPSPGLFT